MRAYGRQRMAEARAATGHLSVAPAGQLFLGYPDGGLLALLTQYRWHAYRSRFTGVAAVPYTEALFPQRPYTGAALERDFAAVIRRVQPTLVLAPSPLDSHPDHQAAGLLAMASARQRAVGAGALLDRARRGRLADPAGADARGAPDSTATGSVA